MKQTIQFNNDGVLDQRAFKVMGMSAKSDGAIGQFGTGLKYAIAGILRTGGEINIVSGGERYDFSLKSTTMRDKEFSLIVCNGEELAYTAEYGKHWTAWQWFRELYSNALDEGGNVTESNAGYPVYDTVITVDHPEIFECYQNIDQYFLSKSRKPILSTPLVDIYKKDPTCKSLFYKGVRVAEWDTRFTYNIKGAIDLTEDRTIKYPFESQRHIASGLALLKKVSHIRLAFKEGNSDWDRVQDVSQEILDEVQNRLLENPNCKLPSGLRDLYISERGEFEREELELTDRNKKQLEKAINFLGLIDFEITAPIKLVESKGDSLYGEASDGEIWLTSKAFEHGTFDLATTLLEEHVHLETGHGDETRELQQWLFNRIVLMGEQLVGDIL